MNEKLLRLVIVIFTAALHLFIIFFLVFNTEQTVQEEGENARVMKVTDLDELPPPEPEPEIPQVEAIAETLIETDIPPVQTIVATGTLQTFDTSDISDTSDTFEDFLPMHKLSTPPWFDTKEIASVLVYPPIAQRSGIEGRVIIELFVDRNGVVQQVIILQESPENRGFGEAAVKAFTNRKGKPAIANGEAVSARYRYPVTFKLK
jgi:protein TonB